MSQYCWHCGKFLKNEQARKQHLRTCPIRRVKLMGYLPEDFSLYHKCPWFKDGNPYLKKETDSEK